MSEDNQNTVTGSTPSLDDASFEQLVQRLEEVVMQLEEGDLPLSRSLEVFEEGVRLSRLGARRLDEAERRVEELLQNDDPSAAVSTRALTLDESH